MMVAINRILLVCLFVGCTLLASCEEKEAASVDATLTTSWMADRYRLNSGQSFRVPTAEVELEFLSADRFLVHMEANSCVVDYAEVNEENLRAYQMACGLECCDSREAERIIELISDSDYHRVDEEDRLVFYGDGRVEFVRGEE